MDIFDLLTMVGGLSLFLFGMSVMGQALERRAGGKLKSVLGRLTRSPAVGLLTGMGVTAAIQSSSATTVMVIGFVNSGLMTLRQAIYVIMGANVGTTFTAWVLSLAGLSSGNVWIKLLKPSSFTPVLALMGVFLYMGGRSEKKRDTGTVLLGFATLMFGMETMSGAVAGLGELPGFQKLFVAFRNPILGVLAGAVLTAVVQSSSASMGILQALAVTGQVSYGAAIPIIMGQNIGTCVTAMLSSVGANRNAKRAAMVHLLFNVVGTAVWLTAFYLLRGVVHPAVLEGPASLLGIAVAHSVFNVLCIFLMLPLAGVLEAMVNRLVPGGKGTEAVAELDERLLATPPVALERCREMTEEMARTSKAVLEEALTALTEGTSNLGESIREREKQTDHYEDILGTYLVRLSASPISAEDNAQAARLLKMIGDFERIADHGLNLLESAEVMKERDLTFTGTAQAELGVLVGAVREIQELALTAFLKDDPETAVRVESLEEVVDRLKEELRSRHIGRMQKGECSLETGVVWSDLLTDLERVADHASNIAGCVMEKGDYTINLHETLRRLRERGGEFRRQVEEYGKKYHI